MNFLLKILLTLTAFSLGMFLTKYFLPDIPEIDVAQNDEILSCPMEAVKVVSFCDINDFPGFYTDEWIETRATVYAVSDKEYFLVPFDCYFTKGFSAAYVDLENFNDLAKILKDKKPFKKEIDIKVSGVIRKLKDNSKNENLIIIPNTIEVISPFRKFEPRGAA